MRVKALLILIVLMALATPAGAQGYKGTPDPLQPVGPLPWPVPVLPYLRSPTPWPTVATPTPLAATYTPSPTATATLTPTPPATPHDTEHESMATLVGQNQEAIQTLQALDGQTAGDLSMATAAAQVGDYAGQFFAYAKGLELFNIKGTGGVVTFMLLAFLFVILVILGTAILPMLATLANWIVKILRLLGEFIPF